MATCGGLCCLCVVSLSGRGRMGSESVVPCVVGQYAQCEHEALFVSRGERVEGE